MTVIRDRRNEPPSDQFLIDIARYKKRVVGVVKQAIQTQIAEGNLEDIGKGGIKVPIPRDLIHEPFLHHKGNGRFTRVFPGNKGHIPAFSSYSSLPYVFPGNTSLDVGDKVPIPKGGGGGGGGGGGSGQGKGNGPEGSEEDSDAQDDFVWVNEADYLDALFDGRELPDMTKLKAKDTVITERRRVGNTPNGPMHRLNDGVTDQKRREESLVLARGLERQLFKSLTEQFNIMSGHTDTVPALDITGMEKTERNKTVLAANSDLLPEGMIIPQGTEDNSAAVISVFREGVNTLFQRTKDLLDEDELHRVNVLRNRVDEQIKEAGHVGKFRQEQLRFHYDLEFPKPNAKAVMICMMDVSASMGQEEKNTAKVFFWLLKKFLDANYKKVDLVFIAHTTQAKEVDEKTFFYGRVTGGTIVSTCLKKAQEILKARYSTDEWNIYSAQASDGGNSSNDNPELKKVMEELLPILQAHYYVEVAHPYWRRPPSEMHDMYAALSPKHGGKIYTANGLQSASDALEAFKKFFPASGGKPQAVNAMDPAGP